MKSIPLLPSSFKNWGWCILAPALLTGIVALFSGEILSLGTVEIPVPYNSGFFLDQGKSGFFQWTSVDILSNVSGILILIGGLLVGFSREKEEDEFISSLRLGAVLWSLFVSYSLVLLLFLTVFGTLFFSIMVIAMYLPLLLYILRFQYLLYKHNVHEK